MRFRRIFLTVLGVVSFAATHGAAQPLQSEGVIYAFTQMRLGNAQQYVLLPVAADTVRPDQPLSSSIPSAFLLLRNGKPAIYGNTSITATDDLLSSGRVVVNIDPSRAGNFELIAAETIYTFSQLGVDSVEFPGFSDSALQRDDVTFAAYRMQVPMWQAVVAGRVHESDIVLEDGSLVASDDFYQRLDDGDARLQQQVLDVLSEGNDAAQFAILGVIAGLNISNYEAAVIPSLSHASPALRDVAMRALAPSSSQAAWDAIVNVMNTDAEPALRTVAAQFVAASPIEAVRLNELFFRATTPDPAVRVTALREMALIADPRVPLEMVRYVGDADPGVAQTAIDGLTTLNAWDALANVMNEPTAPEALRLAASGALATAATGEARLAGLQFRASVLRGEQAVGVVNAIAALTDVDPRLSIEGMLAHPDSPVRIRATQLLAERGAFESIAALSDAADAAGEATDVRDAAADAAWTILLAAGAERVGRSTTDSDPFVRAAAFRALGTLAQQGQGGADVFTRLVAGLADGDDQIRAACVLAVGGFATQEALDAVLAVQTDSSPRVVGAMARSLGNFPGEGWSGTVNPLAIDLLNSGEPEIIAGAVEALGMLGQTQLRQAVISMVGFPDPRVRASAMRAAVQLVDPLAPREVISAVSGQLRDEVPANRVLAARLLGGFSEDSAVLLLSQVVNDPDMELRVASIEALGRTGIRGAGLVLIGIVEDPDRNVRLVAINALRALNLRSLATEIEAAAARSPDPVTVEAMLEAARWLNQNGV